MKTTDDYIREYQATEEQHQRNLRKIARRETLLRMIIAVLIVGFVLPLLIALYFSN